MKRKQDEISILNTMLTTNITLSKTPVDSNRLNEMVSPTTNVGERLYKVENKKLNLSFRPMADKYTNMIP